MNEPGRSTKNEFTVAPMHEEHIPVVADLLLAQERRHRERDPRLRAMRSREQVIAQLAERLAAGEPLLVALNQEQQVRGFASPGVWELAETSILRAFLPERAGVTRDLALADRQEGDASRVLAALLVALSSWWKAQETTGEIIRWPAVEQWPTARFSTHGFQLDSICAIRPSGEYFMTIPPPADLCTIRSARPSDEVALVNLFAEELRYHERCTPFVHCNPVVLAAFQRKLARLWTGAGLEAGAPLVLVAERTGEVIGMAETTLLDISPDDEPGFTLPGRYGCLDNVSIHEARRGQGIGKLLVKAVYDAFAALPLTLDGWLLWYNPDNQQASRFWAHRGFVPLWMTYQRLHPLAEK
jgi:GNAT superfamily N-acetyltransferase